MNIMLQITRSCNFQCRHCHDNCGPDGNSMEKETLEAVVSHIPQSTEQIIVSGGEPLVKPRLFWYTMELLAVNRNDFPKALIALQTNAFWARNTDAAYVILRQLYQNGLDRLVLTGLDKYHGEEGLDLSKLDEAESPLAYALQRLGNPFEVVRRVDNQDIMPFGRAKELPKEELARRSICDVPWGFEKNLTVDTSGLLYPCCWKVTPPMGSAKEKSIEKLVRKARKKGIFKRNRIFHALERGGPMEAARVLGIEKEGDDYGHECRMCEEIFRRYR